MHPADATLPLERRQIGADGDLAHPEARPSDPDGEEAVLEHGGRDPVPADQGVGGCHGTSFRLLAETKAPFRYRNAMTSGIRRTSTLLADGRELIYFDDADTTLGPERAVDSRALDPRPETATMRQDVLTGEWISIAAARQSRVHLPPAQLDPLAPQSPGQPLRGAGELRRRGLREPIPLVRSRARRARRWMELTSVGLGRSLPAVGRCEVVCFSPETHRLVRHADRRPRPHRHRGVGGSHGRALGDAGHRRGLPVRESRRADRGDPASSARPDLRLSLRDAAHDEHAGLRGPHLARPVPAHPRLRASRRARRAERRALDRVRAVRRPLADRGAPHAAPARARLRRDERR